MSNEELNPNIVVDLRRRCLEDPGSVTAEECQAALRQVRMIRAQSSKGKGKTKAAPTNVDSDTLLNNLIGGDDA